MTPMGREKAALRGRFRGLRRCLDREALRRDSQIICARLLALPSLRAAQGVFCYVSYGNEVETGPLLEALLSGGKTLLVPRCRERGRMDCVPVTSLSQLRPGAYGILEPPPELPAAGKERVDFAVVPALACGEDGSRLGQGGGYYDRFLENFGRPSAALCLEECLLPALPAEKHDRPVDWIITQRRAICIEEL